MSDMKHDAIVEQGIPIHERVEIPQDLLPADSMVEIRAKIAAGYYTGGDKVTGEDLETTKGRGWEEETAEDGVKLHWDDVNVSCRPKSEILVRENDSADYLSHTALIGAINCVTERLKHGCSRDVRKTVLLGNECSRFTHVAWLCWQHETNHHLG